MQEFTHFNDAGHAKMSDVSDKGDTKRTAVASGRVLLSKETLKLIRSGGIKKGDVLTVAQIGGIMGVKRTPDIIPMCHPVFISGADIDFVIIEEESCIEITATVSSIGATGVEMEALSAVSIAALTVYDMCKAVQKDMVISNIRLLKKTGGKSGDYLREGE